MSTNVSVKFPLLSVLGVLFIALKLTGVIAWSWWLVLLPFYFWLAVLFGGTAIAVIFVFVVSAAAEIYDWCYAKWRAFKK